MSIEIDKNGTRTWKNEAGELHRVDGPAVEDINGYKAWYLNGIQYTEEKFLEKIKNFPKSLV